ncbi:hypothetical protein GA0074694_4285 [Micromonospora inyonensis]|uniref:Uncharacterized protein n=1 Tax=Micromonospora inyonensis TaxID=47866 RepID=A0A1C6S856_9ACTN|nr:hypothetical protein GA0074694_4285 [Micromonospora inyonensis]
MTGAGEVATVLVVFGRGVRCEQGRYLLTAASIARVEAAVGYVTTHTSSYRWSARQDQPPRVVFTGGWAEACDRAEPPPAGSREADLMVRHARLAGLDGTPTCGRSPVPAARSRTSYRLPRTGYYPTTSWMPRIPWASCRMSGTCHGIRLLAARVPGLRGAALLDVPAFGGEPERGGSERLLRVAARLTLMGARTSADLLRREEQAITRLRRVERALRRPGTAGSAR